MHRILLFSLLLAICFADTAGFDCALAAREVQAAAGAHRLLLLGELHGTREAPAMAGCLLESYAEDGPVLLALELGADEQATIGRYLDSDGDAAARAVLLDRPYWHVERAQSDGRRNFEVIMLIEHARALRAAGRDVSVIAFDIGSLGTGEKASSQARDEAMARRVRTAFARLPRGRMLVLSGNVHAMRAKPSYAPPEMQTPMGSYLGDLSPFAVNIVANGGQFWACMHGRCGPQDVTSNSLASGADDGGTYDFHVVLPRLTIARLIGP